ncbi:MAG TPA: immunoglobulin domain-containing protein [Verrucomicrobiae bacterium]
MYHQKTVHRAPGFSQALVLAYTCLVFRPGAASQLVSWGNYPGDPPPDLKEVRAITVGSVHSVVVDVNGLVTAWGADYNGETNVPINLGPVLAVSAGDGHTLALKQNGTVAAWGFDGASECQVPAGLWDVAAVAAGGLNSMALKWDGTVIAWGYEGNGQTNLPPDLMNIMAISVGGTHSLALKADGTVAAWGLNDLHQTEVPASLTNAVAIAAGFRHSLALTADGRVVAWGDNSAGQCNVPAGLSRVAALAAGETYSMALKADGTVIAWGTGLSTETNVPPGLTNVVAIATASTYCMALLGGTMPYVTSSLLDRTVAQGFPVYFRATAVGSLPLSFQWKFNGVEIPGATDPVLALNSAAPADQGYYSIQVSNAFGAVESDAALLMVAPLWIRIQPHSQAGFWGNPVTFAVEVTSGLPLTYQWQFNGLDLPGETNRTLLLPSVQPADAGYYAVVVSNPAGSVRSADAALTISQIAAWGFNPYYTVTNVPPNLTNVIGVASGFEHSLVLRADGTVTEWGDTANWPTQAPAGLNDAVSLAAGGLHSLALRGNGTVIGWGDNSSGQVSIPAGLSNVVAVAAGVRHSLALRADGSVLAWGDNSSRQTIVPAGLNNIVRISAGTWHNLALRADGSIAVWGSSAAYLTNVPPGLTNAVAVAAGSYHNLALSADGRVFAWGQTGSPTNVPPDLTNAVAIAASPDHSIALKSDGTFAVWGNSWALVNPPVGLLGITAVAAGEYTSMALIGEGPPVLRRTVTNVSGVYGRTVYLRAEATGAPPMTYQWRFNGADLPGATNAVLELGDLRFEEAGAYTVVAANSRGAATNSPINLVVLPLLITAQPQSLTVLPAATARFDVGVLGQPPLRYQWQFNGTDLLYATNSYLVRTNVQIENAGRYDVIVSNDVGFARSADALLTVSRVIAWGTNNYGQLNIPGNLMDVVAVAAGLNHSVALRNDGTVVAWGDNRYGQTNVPAGLSAVVSIAAGPGNHSLALRSDGTVVGWGANGSRQTNVPAGLANVIAVAAGGSHSLALKADGGVVAWGNNVWGQTNVSADLTSVVGIAGLSNSSAALRADGTIVTWGAIKSIPLTNLVSIAGGSSVLGLQASGKGVTWSGGRFPGLFTPPGFSNLVAVSANLDHYLGLKTNGTIVSSTGLRFLDVPAGLTNMGMIAAGAYHGVAASAAGQPFINAGLPDRTLLIGSTDYFWVSATGARPLSYQWRCNGTNILGATSAVLTLYGVQSNRAGLYSVTVSNALGVATSREFAVNLAALWITNQPQDVLTFQGGSAVFSVRAAGVGSFRYQWQFNGSDLPGATSSTLSLANVQVSQSGAYTVRVSNAYGDAMSRPAMLSVNRVVAWGDNTSGMTNVPAGLSNAVAISVGISAVTALKSDGTIRAWGRPAVTNIPPGLSNVVAVSCGYVDALALKADGTVAGWGGSYPVPDGLSEVVEIIANGSFNAALRADGTVVAWGDNSVGQTNVPPELTNVVSLSSRHASHTLALIEDGTVAAWGLNDSGQTALPEGLTNIVSVSAAYSLSVALREDGTVVAWGDNTYGQTNVPAGLTNVVKISSNGFTVLALRADGTLVAWGSNSYGETNVPTGLSNVVDMVAGGSCAALKQDGTIVTWGATLPGQAIASLLRNVVFVAAGGAYAALLSDGPPAVSRTVADPFWRPFEFGFSFPTERGRVYLVEFKDALTDRVWGAFPLVRGNGRVRAWTDNSIPSPTRFYRVRCW